MAIEKKSKQQFLTQRAQIALASFGLWLLLALWSLTAFWAHIDSLTDSYKTGAKIGAAAGEFALLWMVIWHCFSVHINVRRWSLIFSFIFGSVLLLHAGALRGMSEAKADQIESEKRLADGLSKMSTQQAAAIADSNAEASKMRSQKERLALANKTNKQQKEIALNAQNALKDEIIKGNDKVKDSSILPRWYLDGWMYNVIFILGIALLGALSLMMMNKEDIDADFDGIPDRLQQGTQLQYVDAPPFRYVKTQIQQPTQQQIYTPEIPPPAPPIVVTTQEQKRIMGFTQSLEPVEALKEPVNNPFLEPVQILKEPVKKPVTRSIHTFIQALKQGIHASPTQGGYSVMSDNGEYLCYVPQNEAQQYVDLPLQDVLTQIKGRVEARRIGGNRSKAILEINRLIEDLSGGKINA